MKYYSKELLILTYALIGSNAYYERITDLGLSLKGGGFIGLLLVCLFGIVLTSYIKNHALRGLYALVIFLSSVIYLSYENITASYLSYNSFITLINARGFAGEAFVQYFLQITASILVSSLLLIAIILKPKYKHKLPNILFILAPMFAVLLLIIVFFLRGGNGGKGLRSPFIPLAYAGLAIYETSNNIVGERKEIQIGRNGKIIDYDIILIIDESISPSYLDINSKYGVLTNLKDADVGINIFNYGYAAAIANCSYATNLTLRYGGTRDDYLAINSTMPSIWQYAKKADLHTVYIDAQLEGMKLQNGMTIEETAFIDEFIQFDDVPMVSRDLAAASKLIEFINNPVHDFIIINKIGGHFPVHDKYPDQFELYKPTLPRGRFTNITHADITDISSRKGFLGESDDWLLYRNSYRNTLLWGVGHFFEEILTKSNLDNAVIIYTSDHGQDLHESGNPGTYTQCSSNPRMDEGMVPMVVIQGAGLKTLDWGEYLINNKNSSSHYNIFPTLLHLMSYESTEVKEFYGNSLNMLTDDDMTFNTLFHARLGKKAKWKKIEPMNISTPSECRHTQSSLIRQIQLNLYCGG